MLYITAPLSLHASDPQHYTINQISYASHRLTNSSNNRNRNKNKNKGRKDGRCVKYAFYIKSNKELLFTRKSNVGYYL